MAAYHIGFKFRHDLRGGLKVPICVCADPSDASTLRRYRNEQSMSPHSKGDYGPDRPAEQSQVSDFLIMFE
jgi:hypothetical protein